MKQRIITGLKKELLLVERDGVLLQTWRDIYDAHPVIGKLTDIKEYQFEEIVQDHNGLYEYPDYTRNSLCFLPTAKESFFSKLEYDEIYFKNPFSKPEDDDYSFYTHINLSVQEEWQQAQDKVWDINRCWLFLIM